VFMKWDDEAVNEIAKKYQQMIGMEINCTVGAFLKKCMYAGMDWLVVLDAIEKTGWARNPTAYYLRAILSRYLNEGIRTLEDVREDDARRETERRRASYNRRSSWFD
ncbi:MAG: hypothetical protein ACSW8J_02880, partial [bacterium]